MCKIRLYNEDCLPAMRRMADNQFQLAVVDPPYGILSKSGDRLDKYGGNRRKWDVKIPSNKYFIELTRISKNQIIWGGNYFPFLWKNGCKGFIFWYKHQPVSDWAAGELAWTSFNTPSRCFDYICYGGVNQDKNRIHPTQKPVALYKWILRNYAKEGNKILDTHLGSGSIAIACHDYGFDLTGYEIDKDYFEAAKKRLETHQMQQRINFEN